MPRVRQAVEIAAPVEEVFAYLDVPANGLALVPQLVEVKEISPLPNGGHRIRFVTVGRRGNLCESVTEHIERVPNRLVAVRSQTEGVTSTTTRRFEETASGTLLSAEVEYRVELPWPQKALTPLIEFQWRRPMGKQLRSVLEMVKGRIEAASAAVG